MSRLPSRLAAGSIAAVAGLAAWGWALHPDEPGRWIVRMTILPILLGAIVLRMPPAPERSREAAAIFRWHQLVFAWIGALVALELAVGLAVSAELLDPAWIAQATRARGLLIGSGLAVWGNLLPALLSPWGMHDEPFDWQRVHRFVGRTALLAGALIMLVWLALPLGPAGTLSRWIGGTWFVLGLGRKLASLMSMRYRGGGAEIGPRETARGGARR